VSTQQAAVIDLAVRTKLLGSGRVSRARLAELPTRRAALLDAPLSAHRPGSALDALRGPRGRGSARVAWYMRWRGRYSLRGWRLPMRSVSDCLLAEHVLQAIAVFRADRAVRVRPSEAAPIVR